MRRNGKTVMPIKGMPSCRRRKQRGSRERKKRSLGKSIKLSRSRASIATAVGVTLSDIRSLMAITRAAVQEPSEGTKT